MFIFLQFTKGSGCSGAYRLTFIYRSRSALNARPQHKLTLRLQIKKCQSNLSAAKVSTKLNAWTRFRYIIHAYTTLKLSCAMIGIGSNAFVYPGIGDLPYIRCFYFSFKMAAGIGKNVKPTHELEYIFMAFLWLQGW